MFSWHQIAFETAMFFTAIITVTCIVLLSHQGFHVLKQRRRFSLRDLFIVFTLVAALAGLMIGMSKESKEGIPRKTTSQLFREYQEHQH
jgi:nucleoside recognition membrane protein YjiH